MEITLEGLYLFFSNPIVLTVLAVTSVILTVVALYLRFFVHTAGQRNLHSYACRYPDDKDKVSVSPMNFLSLVSHSMNDMYQSFHYTNLLNEPVDLLINLFNYHHSLLMSNFFLVTIVTAAIQHQLHWHHLLTGNGINSQTGNYITAYLFHRITPSRALCVLFWPFPWLDTCSPIPAWTSSRKALSQLYFIFCANAIKLAMPIQTERTYILCALWIDTIWKPLSWCQTGWC